MHSPLVDTEKRGATRREWRDQRQGCRDSENLPNPEILAAEIAEDLRAALEAFEAIQAELETTEP